MVCPQLPRMIPPSHIKKEEEEEEEEGAAN